MSFKRIVAYISDCFLFAMSGVFIVTLLAVFVASFLKQPESSLWFVIYVLVYPHFALIQIIGDYRSDAFYDICILLGLLIFIEAISNFFITQLTQKTVGQSILHLKITDRNGNKVKWYNMLLRCFIKIISKYLLFIPFAIAIFSKERLTLHDIIARTKVVDDNKEQDQYVE
ncbi:hypothetical protein FACS1894132_03210 [Clostridia bacterium]|nr:hypothetical protein FACS1894132_03210 [Clostridia bacterium]